MHKLGQREAGGAKVMSGRTPLIRADFSDDHAWLRLVEAVNAPSPDGFVADLCLIDDLKLADAGPESLLERQRQNCVDAGIGKLLHENGELSRAFVQIQANHGRTGNEWGFVTNWQGEIVEGVSKGTADKYNASLRIMLHPLAHNSYAGSLIIFYYYMNQGLSEDNVLLGDHARNSFGSGEPISASVVNGEMFCSRGKV